MGDDLKKISAEKVADDLTKMSAEKVADEYGRLNQQKKSIETKLEKFKAEILRRGLSFAKGAAWIISASESTSTRLDTEAMRADPKLAKLLPKFEKTSTSTRILVKPVPVEIEAAAE
ncbi:hypothetical protein V5F77_04205 [Xanthobacter sp. DSM 24535]|uniref:hypothetical protein n=1 Tax=Roseixanthobacter psychrophilus TaxID=3119917 RepID=UPI0037262DBB